MGGLESGAVPEVRSGPSHHVTVASVLGLGGLWRVWLALIGFAVLGAAVYTRKVLQWRIAARRSQTNVRPAPIATSSKVSVANREIEVPVTRFDDVAGAQEVVEELADLVDYFANLERYDAAGADLPHGFLLTGPPGTGKVLLARAVAGEAGVPFFAMAAAEFVEMHVGVGATRIRKLFQRARSTQPAVVFVDEFDAVGRKRSTRGPANNEARQSTLNQLLIVMDGFARSSVVVIGATNRPDVLDPALLRPGRFDRQISVPSPDPVQVSILPRAAAGGATWFPVSDELFMSCRQAEAQLVVAMGAAPPKNCYSATTTPKARHGSILRDARPADGRSDCPGPSGRRDLGNRSPGPSDRPPSTRRFGHQPTRKQGLSCPVPHDPPTAGSRARPGPTS